MQHVLATLGRLILPALTLFAFISSQVPAMALSQTDESDALLSPQSLCTTGSSDGHAQVQSMLEHVRRMKGYCFESVLTTYKGDKPTIEVGKIYFKSPNLIRFEVIKSGSRSGSVVVRQPDGKVRGQMGGIFRGIKVTLSPDSKMLKSANGFNIIQSDLESLLVGLERMLKDDLKVLATAAAPGRPALVEVLQDGGVLLDRIAVDGHADVPCQWNIFTANKLFSVLRLNNLAQRNDLPDSLFIIGDDPGTKALEGFGPASHCGVEALQKLAGQPLSLQVCKEVSCLMDEAGSIKNSLPDDCCDKDGQWSPAIRVLLLASGTRLEEIIYQLSPVSKAIAITGRDRTEADGTAADWDRSTAACRNSVALMLEQVLSEKPDTEVLSKASMDLKSAIHALQAASKRAEGLL